MPIIKSAKKKLKQDRRKAVKNKKHKDAFKKVLKSAAGAKSITLDKVYKAIDKAVAKKVIHKNKAARLKSNASKRYKKATAKKTK